MSNQLGAVKPEHHLREAAQRLAQARLERDKAIFDAYMVGVSGTQLAEAAGLSRMHVWRIVQSMTLEDDASDVDGAFRDEQAGEPTKPERWRCLHAGCNPKLDGPTAIKHGYDAGHRVAKWPVRSTEGKRREQERNRTGYHRKYGRGFDRSGETYPAHGNDEEDAFHGGDSGQD